MTSQSASLGNVEATSINQSQRDALSESTDRASTLARPKIADELAARIADWLRAYLANLLNAPPSSFDADQPFASFGLDSASTLALTGELGDWLGLDLDETLLFEHSSISSLSLYLAAHSDTQSAILAGIERSPASSTKQP